MTGASVPEPNAWLLTGWDGGKNVYTDKSEALAHMVFVGDTLEPLVPLLTAEAYAAARPAVEQHPDDAAVDRFAQQMKDKLSQARAIGRDGWQTIDAASLSRMLREHVEKGDPVDVANFCMFLSDRSYGIAAPSAGFAEKLLDLVDEYGQAVFRKSLKAETDVLAAIKTLVGGRP